MHVVILTEPQQRFMRQFLKKTKRFQEWIDVVPVWPGSDGKVARNLHNMGLVSYNDRVSLATITDAGRRYLGR